MLEALQTAGLLDEFQAAKDVTLFVPYDAAWYKVGSIFDGMSVNDLRDLLRYHMVQGNVTYAAELENGGNNVYLNLTTMQGSSVAFTYDGAFWVNNNVLADRDDGFIANGNIIYVNGFVVFFFFF